MDATTHHAASTAQTGPQTTQTGEQTADQTAQTEQTTTQLGPCPDEHLATVRYIRRQMTADGMDWRAELPTKKYCMAMAVRSGRRTCGDSLGVKLRTWVQTAPWSAEDDLDLDGESHGPLRPAADADSPAPTLPAAATATPQTAPEQPELEQTGLQTEPDQAADHLRTAETAEQTRDSQRGPDLMLRTGLSRLRFLPPIASLGLSAVMQVIIVTDLLGNALDDRYGLGAWAFVIAAAFGGGIACALEGSAAYILDLYKKHLLARDSTLSLRVLLLAYVSGSAALIHWWTDRRQLPWEMALVLSLLAGSSIVLWTMGSKWENRVQMRANGQIDEALPRLSTAAKFWHPLRWLRTLFLTSWEPAQTTAEARERYAVWAADRADRKARPRTD